MSDQMPSKLIDGKKISQEILQKAKLEVAHLANAKIYPKLAVVQVGADQASTIYTEKKHKTCQEVGLRSELIRLHESTTQEELLRQVKELNNDKSVHGILVQLPLPKHIDEKAVIETILPAKDVDGFSPVNQGKNLSGQHGFRPATPKGIMKLIHSTGKNLSGMNAVVVGRSNIVGKPIAAMLLNADCTVTVCHSKTKRLADFTRNADILVVAAGKPKLIRAGMVKKGAIVIDVGMNRSENDLTGDVDFGPVSKKAGWITPVPGGVGPMTIACLIENTLQACREQNA